MPEYIMPSEGNVDGITFDSLDDVTQGYIEALFFTSNSHVSSDEWFNEENQALLEEGQLDGRFPNDLTFGDIHPDSLKTIIDYCNIFMFKTMEIIVDIDLNNEHYDKNRVGNDLYFSSNGHGTGFWDRQELLSIHQDILDNAAKKIPEINDIHYDGTHIHLY